jgi:hypothetical protein
MSFFAKRKKELAETELGDRTFHDEAKEIAAQLEAITYKGNRMWSPATKMRISPRMQSVYRVKGTVPVGNFIFLEALGRHGVTIEYPKFPGQGQFHGHRTGNSILRFGEHAENIELSWSGGINLIAENIQRLSKCYHNNVSYSSGHRFGKGDDGFSRALLAEGFNTRHGIFSRYVDVLHDWEKIIIYVLQHDNQLFYDQSNHDAAVAHVQAWLEELGIIFHRMLELVKEIFKASGHPVKAEESKLLHLLSFYKEFKE